MTFSTDPLPLLARRLKEIRRHSGLSQMELGVRAGIDECTASARINQYERGKHTPDFLTVCNLARVLGVDATYFYAERDDLAELIALFNRLNAAEQEKVLKFAALLLSQAADHAEPSIYTPGASG
jgi:transcriptional regulator with XRE-family HTH domain